MPLSLFNLVYWNSIDLSFMNPLPYQMGLKFDATVLTKSCTKPDTKVDKIKQNSHMYTVVFQKFISNFSFMETNRLKSLLEN